MSDSRRWGRGSIASVGFSRDGHDYRARVVTDDSVTPPSRSWVVSVNGAPEVRACDAHEGDGPVEAEERIITAIRAMS